MLNHKILISVDGNVNAGKTTLFKSLADSDTGNNTAYIGEHTDFLSLTSHAFVNTDGNPQDIYIATEFSRRRVVIQSPKSLFLLDRSFVSILAHTLATTFIGSEQRCYVLNRLCVLIEDDAILVPDCFLFLDVERSISVRRFEQNHREKGTGAELIGESYFSQIRAIYSSWIGLVGGLKLDKPEQLDIKMLDIARHKPRDLALCMKKLSSTDWKI